MERWQKMVAFVVGLGLVVFVIIANRDLGWEKVLLLFGLIGVPFVLPSMHSRNGGDSEASSQRSSTP